MAAVRKLDWLGVWIAASAAAFGLIAVWTYAHGGVFHRVPVCGGPDMNVYAASVLACGIGLVAGLLYWALGATAMRWRVVRLAGVAAAGVVVAFAVLIGMGRYAAGCSGAPTDSRPMHGGYWLTDLLGPIGSALYVVVAIGIAVLGIAVLRWARHRDRIERIVGDLVGFVVLLAAGLVLYLPTALILSMPSR